MALLKDTDRYELMAQPHYGFDCDGEPIQPETGYIIVPGGEVIRKGDKAFDVYTGWMVTDDYHAKNEFRATSRGRWVAWERKGKV